MRPTLSGGNGCARDPELGAVWDAVDRSLTLDTLRMSFRDRLAELSTAGAKLYELRRASR
jgi:hypothetical protein